MRRLHQLRAPTRACVSPLARWRESRREMATVRAKFQSIYQFVVPYQKSGVTNRVPAVAGKNTRTAAAEWPNGAWLSCVARGDRSQMEFYRRNRTAAAPAAC